MYLKFKMAPNVTAAINVIIMNTILLGPCDTLKCMLFRMGNSKKPTKMVKPYFINTPLSDN